MNFFLFVLIFGYVFMDNSVKAQDGIIHFVDNDSDEQSCKIANVTGKCLPIGDCTTLNPAMNETFTFCPIVVRYLPKLVCCPQIQTISNSSSRMTSRISHQKCEEYKSNPIFFEMNIFIDDIFDENVEHVVGGVNTFPAEFPHMAAVGWIQPDKTSAWNCGGSLISEIYVLTAAHCSINGENKAPDFVRISERNLKRTKPWDYQQFDIAEITTHPNYKYSSVYDDIALIKLNEKVKFGLSIRPACLWQTNDIDENTAVATGWGSTGYLEDSAEILQKVTLNIITNEQCQTYLKPQNKFSEGVKITQMCAGELSGGKDTCQGDSGGPLQLKPISGTKNMYYLIGITSFGKFCAAPNSPGVYTRISSYIDWIESIVWSPK